VSDYRIAVGQPVLDDLRARIAATRWAPAIAGAGWDRGTDIDYLHALAARWLEYDWRAHEAELNELDHVRIEVDGFGLHAVHQRAADPGAVPLLLLHGWPDSFLRYRRVLPLLRDFHVVVPSLPGYGFSDKPAAPGYSTRRFAELVAGLMTALGYDRFIASGGDIGGGVADWLAHRHADRLLGLHLTDVPYSHLLAVDAPDLKGREGILKVHLRNKPIADDVNITTLARGTPGMAGADLANLVNEAALLAVRRSHEKIYMADLEDAKDKVMLGAERKSMVMKEEERRLTAYHEGGHAICAMRVKGNDPLHKVTIVPRGRALGLAFTLPEDDRVSVTRQQLEARLVMAYGGRTAEELIFGHDRVTTGAASDIQQATNIARRYVTQWGLSDKIGPILVGDNEQELFLGREIQHRREVSEQTAQLVDAEVKALINRTYDMAKATLQENIGLLHKVAAALLERETLTRDDIEVLSRGDTLPPRTPGGAPPTAPAPATQPVLQPMRHPPLLGGPEPSPA